MILESINLYVENLDDSMEYYSNFGINFNLAGSTGSYAKTAVNNLNLCLYPMHSVKDYYDINTLKETKTSTFNFTFRLDQKKDVDLLFKELKTKNIFPFKGPSLAPWGKYVVFYMDPDGNIMEISANE